MKQLHRVLPPSPAIFLFLIMFNSCTKTDMNSQAPNGAVSSSTVKPVSTSTSLPSFETDFIASTAVIDKLLDIYTSVSRSFISPSKTKSASCSVILLLLRQIYQLTKQWTVLYPVNQMFRSTAKLLQTALLMMFVCLFVCF